MEFKRLSKVSLLLLAAFCCQLSSPDCISAEAKAKKSKSASVRKQPPYPPEFNEAVKLAVVDKKYKDAFEIFDRLDRTGYCRDKTHYYMALCYHNMNQLQCAAQHYKVVYTFSKDPQLKYLSAVGYNQVAKYAANRTYSGQGNIFAKVAANPYNFSGSSSASRSSSSGSNCGPSG